METKRFLITCDLDGTLLNDDSEITEYSKKIIKQLSKDGHLFCITTGRPIRAAINYFNKLELKTLLVNYNGAYISDPVGKKFENNLCFSKEIALDLFKNKKITSRVDNALIEGKAGAYFYKKPLDKKEIEMFYSHFHLKDGGENIVFNSDLSNFNSELNSILIKVKDNVDIDDLIFSIRKLTGTLVCRTWFVPHIGNVIEINSIFSNKGMALKFLSSYYGIPLERCIAFGDGDNDIEMLNKAYYGFAMKNACNSAKFAARFLCKYTNNEDGVCKQLAKFFNYEI